MFKSLRCGVEAKHLMCFQGETSIFTFFRHSMSRAKEYENNFVAIKYILQCDNESLSF